MMCCTKVKLDLKLSVDVYYRYGGQLRLARNEGIKKGFLSSLVIGGLYFVIFSTYALAFWLVWKNLLHSKPIISRVLLHVQVRVHQNFGL